MTRRGRLIYEGEYFGHPDARWKASLSMLIGEVELPQIPVLPHKTDFDRDSQQWAEGQECLHGILKPHIEALLRQQEEDTVTREERRRVATARELLIKALQWLAQLGELQDRFGETRGRKQPQKSENSGKPPSPEKGTAELEGKERKTPEPRTPAPFDAAGGLRRLGNMPPWAVDVLEPSKRSAWRQNGSERVLVINKKYPLYEKWKGDELYIAETAALELAKLDQEEGLTVQRYLEEVDKIIGAFCHVLDSES